MNKLEERGTTQNFRKLTRPMTICGILRRSLRRGGGVIKDNSTSVGWGGLKSSIRGWMRKQWKYITMSQMYIYNKGMKLFMTPVVH